MSQFNQSVSTPPTSGIATQSGEPRFQKSYHIQTSPEIMKYSVQLLSNMCQFMAEERLIDVMLTCQDTAIKAHRLIIGVNSPVLLCVIADYHHVNLNHLDISGRSLCCLVNYMYTGTINVDHGMCLEDLLQAAKKLEMAAAVKIIEERMKKEVGQDLIHVDEKLGKSGKKAKRRKSSATNGCVAEENMDEISVDIANAVKETVVEVMETDHRVMEGDHRVMETDHKVVVGEVDHSVTENKARVIENGFNVIDHELKVTGTESDAQKVKISDSEVRMTDGETREEIYCDGVENMSMSSPIAENLNNEPKDLTDEQNNCSLPESDEKSVGKVVCTECKFVAKSKKALARHCVRKHAENQPMQCPKCGKGFKQQSQLNKHIATHSAAGEDVATQCAVCEVVLPSLSEYKRHCAKEHQSCEDYVCTLCSFSTPSPTKYKNHVTKHSNKEQESILCEVCGKEFSGSLSLKQHVKSVHGDPGFICTKCPYRANTKFSLLSHMARMHSCKLDGTSVERNFKCTDCELAFFTRQELGLHTMKHKGEKPHTCHVCGFATAEKGSLTKHLRLHTGEKPYQCDLCLERFSHPSGIARHKLKHLGKRPFQCDQCSKAYYKKSNLDAHMYVHTNVKPFHCDLCSYSCVKKATLTHHINREHGEKSTQNCARTSTERANNHAVKPPVQLLEPLGQFLSVNPPVPDDFASSLVFTSSHEIDSTKQFVTMDNNYSLIHEAQQASSVLTGNFSTEQTPIVESHLQNQMTYGTQGYLDGSVMVSNAQYHQQILPYMFNMDTQTGDTNLQ